MVVGRKQNPLPEFNSWTGSFFTKDISRNLSPPQPRGRLEEGREPTWRHTLQCPQTRVATALPVPCSQVAEPSTTGQPDQIIFRKLHGFSTAARTEARQQTQETQVQAVSSRPSCAQHCTQHLPSRHPPSGFSGKPAPHKRSN